MGYDMASIVPVACQAVRFVCEASKIYNECDKLLKDRQKGTSLKVASIGMDIILLAIGATESGALAKGASSQVMAHIKQVEMATRMGDGIVKWFELGHDPKAGFWDFIRGFVRPTLSTLRSALEMTAYQDRAYLEMSPAELDAVRRPIYGKGGIVKVGEKRISREEVENELPRASKAARVVTGIEVALRLPSLVKM